MASISSCAALSKISNAIDNRYLDFSNTLMDGGSGSHIYSDPLFSQGYRVMYRLEEDRVLILAVMHGRRDLGQPGNPPWEAQ